MGICFRSSYNASGGNVNLDSFYVVCGDKRWLRGQTITNEDLTTNVIIGDNICNVALLFTSTNINQPVHIGNNCVAYDRIFPGSFNQPVTLGNGITNCCNIFKDASSFNQPITIPDSVTNCYNMFKYAVRFNQNVTLGNNVLNCCSMFEYAQNFNQPITIPNSVVDCQMMFLDAINFNQPVTIHSNRILRFYGMFARCYNFNQSVTIPDSDTNYECSQMFTGCTSLNQPITIGKNATSIHRILFGDTNFNSDVYIRSTSIYADVSYYNNAFGNVKGVKLHFNPVMNNIFNDYRAYGNTEISWTDMSDGNGFYNTTRNIYCYNNYSV